MFDVQFFSAFLTSIFDIRYAFFFPAYAFRLPTSINFPFFGLTSSLEILY
ncbi:hypothetical protein D1BOALGB6SA_8958 [Olavius sp. associated proteobacterium Delta 1]|nr:hypothetical protein D1BOALGB6SA_8958 [Olavius sp. associated proteobacterium Delta 1]